MIVILYILLGILLLLFLITLIRVQIFATYYNELALTVKVLFFKITILPTPEKKEKPKKEKPKKKKKPEQKKKKEKPKKEKEKKPSLLDKLREKKGLSGLVSLFASIARIALGALRDIISHIVVKKFDLAIALSGEDASTVALNYGKLCAAIYPSINVITSSTVCKDYNIAIEPVFNPDRKTEIDFQTHFYLRIIFVIWEALKAGVKILIARIKL